MATDQFTFRMQLSSFPYADLFAFAMQWNMAIIVAVYCIMVYAMSNLFFLPTDGLDAVCAVGRDVAVANGL
jgi:hypothetical protein